MRQSAVLQGILVTTASVSINATANRYASEIYQLENIQRSVYHHAGYYFTKKTQETLYYRLNAGGLGEGGGGGGGSEFSFVLFH